jgi:hypothetical protein
MDTRLHPLPRRGPFVTDADRGYTLDQIHAVEGTGMIYSELHERATDTDRLSILPAVAIMRTADDLPVVGRDFTPEIVSHLTRGTNVLNAGRVEALMEEPYGGPPPVRPASPRN